MQINQPFDVFLSHNNKDKPAVEMLAIRLIEEAQLNVWFDKWNLVPGESWPEEIENALYQSSACAVFLGPHEFGDWHHEEMWSALDQRIADRSRKFRVIPVLLPGAVLPDRGKLPSFLRRLTWVDFSQGLDDDEAFLRLVAGIRGTPPGRSTIGSLGRNFPPVGPTIIFGSFVSEEQGCDTKPYPIDEAKTTPPGATDTSNLKVRLEAVFDRTIYQSDEDTVAKFLLEAEVQPPGYSVKPDIAADIYLILDVSGSMDTTDRYPLLRQAVREFLSQMDANDRVGIIVFSAKADVVSTLLLGVEAKNKISEILDRMDRSPLLFGGATNLAPGLSCALELMEASSTSPNNVRRFYVLTDGELHDSTECREVLSALRPRKTEIHIYGFGTDFDAGSLKRLISDQLGGSVKPICNEKDIVDTFAHIAEVNRRLIAQEALLTLEFCRDITCGDAWVFRPQERYLGQIRNRRLIRELGGLEAGRIYSLLLEVRLPKDHIRPRTPVANVHLSWREGDIKSEHTILVEASRGSTVSQPATQVNQAYSVLDALRHQDDQGIQLAALKAKCELAEYEGRDPGLIAALNKQISILDGSSETDLDTRDQNYLEADEQTCTRDLRKEGDTPK